MICVELVRNRSVSSEDTERCTAEKPESEPSAPPPFTSQDCLLSMILRMVSLRAWWTNGVAVAFMYCSISVLANVVALNNVVASSGRHATEKSGCQCTISGGGISLSSAMLRFVSTSVTFHVYFPVVEGPE